MPAKKIQQRITPARVASASGVGLDMLSVVSNTIYYSSSARLAFAVRICLNLGRATISGVLVFLQLWSTFILTFFRK